MAILSDHLETARIEALRERYFGLRVKADTAWIDGDLRFWGYRWLGMDDSPAARAIWVKSTWPQVCTDCLAELAPQLEPSGMKLVSAELTRLGLLTVARREGETNGEMRALAYAQELSAYPADVVIWACREWPRTADGKWFPAWKELRDLCERRVRRRRALADLCRAQLDRLAQPTLVALPHAEQS